MKAHRSPPKPLRWCAAAATCALLATPCQAQRKAISANAAPPTPTAPRLALELQQIRPLWPAGAVGIVDPRGRLEFKSAAPGGASWTRGLLRVQLAGDSALLLRPRSGGMAVSWQARF